MISTNKLISVFISAVICFGLISVQANSKPLKKPSERSFVVKHSRIVLVPSLTGGVLVGDAADVIEYLDDNFSAKFVYGGGLASEVYLSRQFAIGLHYDLAFKDIPDTDAKPLRSYSTGMYGLFKFYSEKRTIPYLKGEVARIKVKLEDYVPAPGFSPRSLELGTFDCFRIGLGMITHTSSRSTLRSEFFYRIISADGERVTNFGRISFNVSYVGIELAWGINLVGYR